MFSRPTLLGDAVPSPPPLLSPVEGGGVPNFDMSILPTVRAGGVLCAPLSLPEEAAANRDMSSLPTLVGALPPPLLLPSTKVGI
jgi:hypothetical protein